MSPMASHLDGIASFFEAIDQKSSAEFLREVAEEIERLRAASVGVNVGVPEELRALLEKMTPGPWSATRSDPAEGFDCWWLTANSGPNFEVEVGSMPGGYPHDVKEANAKGTAAAINYLRAVVGVNVGVDAAKPEKVA